MLSVFKLQVQVILTTFPRNKLVKLQIKDKSEPQHIFLIFVQYSILGTHPLYLLETHSAILQE